MATSQRMYMTRVNQGSVLNTIKSTSSLCSLKSLVHGHWLAARRMREVREPCLAHAQQQLGQESWRDDVVPAAFPRAAPTKPRLGRGIGVASPERVQRQDLLRDHRDRGQGHA